MPLGSTMGSKYGNSITKVDGINFDSKKEANRYTELKMLQAGKVIRNLNLQPVFEILPAFTDYTGKRHRCICYVADFEYFDNERKVHVVEDVKGVRTEVYKIKLKMFLHKYLSEKKQKHKMIFVEI
jgi:hypothetical protein